MTREGVKVRPCLAELCLFNAMEAERCCCLCVSEDPGPKSVSCDLVGDTLFARPSPPDPPLTGTDAPCAFRCGGNTDGCCC